VFVTVSYFHTSLTFARKDGPYPYELLCRLYSKLLAGLQWKQLTVTNTPGYNSTSLMNKSAFRLHNIELKDDSTER
jgi:hypothetical protein